MECHRATDVENSVGDDVWLIRERLCAVAASPLNRPTGGETGEKSGAVSVNPSKTNAGATVQPTSVHSPRLSACCQWPAGTMACGRSPSPRSEPSRMLVDWSARRRDFKQQRIAGIEVPGFGGVDGVPVRSLAGFEQEIDGGRSCALSRFSGIAKRLAVMAALGVRRKPEHTQSRHHRRDRAS